MNVSFPHLKSFLAVAQARSLREAADVLELTQPAVSKHIAHLEQQLGRALFLRHGRGMRLTPAGQELLEAVGGSVDTIESALRGLRAQGGLEDGHLTITSLSTMATYLVPGAVARLLRSHPQLRLNVLVGNSVEVVEQVERGKADIGVVYDVAVDGDGFDIVPLHEERIGVFVRTGAFELPGDLSVDDLLALPLLLPNKPLALRRILERECGRPLLPAVECNTSDVALRLAAQGLGIALLPEDMPPECVEACGLERRSLLGGKVRRRVVAIARQGRSRTRALEAALRELQAHGRVEGAGTTMRRSHSPGAATP